VKAPSYDQVCSGTTGHTEVVRVTFDSAQVSFERVCAYGGGVARDGAGRGARARATKEIKSPPPRPSHKQPPPPKIKNNTKQLLDVFWENHDPTSKDRQGNDSGTQYRAGVYTTSPAQAEAAQRCAGFVRAQCACS
jgi:peptide-methionine (S)-S-oxide reductase